MLTLYLTPNTQYPTPNTNNFQSFNPSILQLLLIEHIEPVDGSVQLNGIQLEVFQRVERAVADVEHPRRLLFDNGVLVDDESVVEVIAHNVPVAECGVGERKAHTVVGGGVLHAQHVVEQGCGNVVVGGAVAVGCR